jgi:two-component sensor histidine kinase
LIAQANLTDTEVGMSAAENVAPLDLYITLALHRRVPKVADYLGEKLALQDIAAQMLDHPEQVLPVLVERAMRMTGAVSAGISAFEPEEGTAGIFRWRNLHGELARFEGAITPRNYSPCGVCLDRFEPTLTRRPERYYSWIAEAGVVCPEVLLVPLSMARGQPLGTLWIVSEAEGYFDSGHARIMRELASFAGVALAMLTNQERLQAAVIQQEMLTAEMDHRVKNLFAVVDAMIRVGGRSAASATDLATTLSGRLRALAAAHALVRHSFRTALNVPQPPAVTLRALADAILKPYEVAGSERFVVTGEEISLGGQATTGLALIFHELATNAAKYGALSRDEGRVSVSWERQGEMLAIRWRERGGPPIEAEPGQVGFGSTLAHTTVARQFGGTFALNWQEQGLLADFALPLPKLAN